MEKEEGKVKVNNEANSVKKYSNDKKTRRKNKSRKTKSNNPKKIEVKDKELLINAENETNEKCVKDIYITYPPPSSGPVVRVD